VRRSARIPKEVPILLIGSDLDGRVFSEHTSTVLLSLHGAGILSRHKLSPEQELVLRWTEKNKEAEIRVVGHLGEQSGQHTYGVAFFDQNLNFWEIDFPPISEIEKQLGLLSLVCSSCKTLEKIDDSSFEADICSTNDGVLRYCQRCGSSTLWKSPSSAANPPSASPQTTQMPLFSAPPTPPPAPIPAPPSNSIPAPVLSTGSGSSSTQTPASSPVPPPAPAPSFYAQSHNSPQDSAYTVNAVGQPRTAVLTMSPPVPAAPVAPPANRRRYPRVKVTYSACIRHPERGDEIVTCEDMSKGGLRFKCRKQYYAQSLIEVAVPYQPGQPAIFVPARIVFVEPLPEQSLFRCGIEYFKPTKPRDHF